MKKCVSILCLIALLLSLFCCIPTVQANTSSVRNRKIVSMVYDDSGSMHGEKWEYTNYATQCFAAMLNKEDRLDITYMSSYYYGSFSVDTDDRATSVQQIREHYAGGGTPVEAVDTAFQTLKAANDTNVNTQYWLIIMTDGEMDGVERKVNNLADSTMPNGTKPHIVYLSICDVSGLFTPSFSKSNIESRAAKTADEIIDVISDISCNIAGRYPVEQKSIKVIDSKTVQVTSDLPLINIGILTQRSSATVVSVADNEGNALQDEGNVPVKAPGRFPDFLSKEALAAMTGNVALFGKDQGNINAGTYNITFSEEVSKEDLVIMFEPAFELRLELSVDGQIIDDLTQLTEETEVDVEAVLYEFGTGNRIATSMLPNGYTTSITLTENGKQISSDKGLKLKDVKLKAIETEISAVLDIPGFFTVQDTVRFTPSAIMLSDMTAEIHYDGSARMTDENGQPDSQNVVYVTSLDTNQTGVRFKLYIDGAPISKDKALALKDKFADTLTLGFPNYQVDVTLEGHIIVTPTKTVLPALIYYWTYGGEQRIESTYDNITAGELLIFKLGDADAAWREFIDFILKIILIIYLILWLFVKKHFRSGLIQAKRSGGQFEPFTLVHSSVKQTHYLTTSGLLNFFGLRGMRIRLTGTPFVVRVTKAGYVVTNVKGLYVSTAGKPNIYTAPQSQRTYGFGREVYIFDGTTYYQIIVQ